MITLNLIKQSGLEPPFFIYDAKKIKERFLYLKNILPKNFDIFYSVKANPNSHILKIFKKLGAGAEISSGGELDLVLKAGFPPGRIIFTGPGKTNEELKSAVQKKIYLIIAESFNEIERLNKIARYLKTKQNILARINPAILCERSDSMFPMAGEGQKFGIDEEKIFHLIKIFPSFSNLNLLGIHFFTGSNIFDEQSIINNTDYLFKLVRSYESFSKRDFPVIDIGGGLALNYSQKNKKRFDTGKLVRGLSFLVQKYKIGDRRIFMESGRFLIGESGSYIAEVVDVKKSHNENFVIINGGVNHISRATLAKNCHDIEVLNKRKTSRKIWINIVGNLNTPTDFITKTRLSEIKIGDFIGIKRVGAYGFSSGMVLFTSRPFPREYLLKVDGKIKTISD